MGQMKEIAALREDIGIPESFPLYKGPGSLLVRNPHTCRKLTYKRFNSAQEYYNGLSTVISLFDADAVSVRFVEDDLHEMRDLALNRKSLLEEIQEAKTTLSWLPVTTLTCNLSKVLREAEYLASKELELSSPDPE